MLAAEGHDDDLAVVRDLGQQQLGHTLQTRQIIITSLIVKLAMPPHSHVFFALYAEGLDLSGLRDLVVSRLGLCLRRQRREHRRRGGSRCSSRIHRESCELVKLRIVVISDM